jgi:phytanoyl-CoA hydroxylase
MYVRDGLWIDKKNHEEVLNNKIKRGVIPKEMEMDVKFFINNGFIVKKCVSPEVCDQIIRDISNKDDLSGKIVKKQGKFIDPLTIDKLTPGQRVIDSYAVSLAVRKAIFTPYISDFLNIIFEEKAIATQSIYFEYGSGQSMHQDTAYVISQKPLHLAAAWIALEDIVEGTGELVYYPGSNYFNEFLFSGKYKAWVPARDGQSEHLDYLAQLHTQAKSRNIDQKRLIAKKGDVLIWHADLAHGGSKITKTLTRRSLVAHYVPFSVKAAYKDKIPDTYHELAFKNNIFTSRHYDLSMINNEKVAIVYDGGITKLKG